MNTTKTKQTAILMAMLAAGAAVRASADDAQPLAGNDKSYTGTITSIDPQEQVLGVKSWLFSKRFNLGDNCAYVLVDQPTGAAGDLKPGETVTVHYRDANGVRIADRVEEHAMEHEGTIIAIDRAHHLMTLRQAGADKTFQLPENCSIQLRNVRTATTADIQTGCYVTVIYDTPNGTPTARTVKQTSIVFSGRVTAIDTDEKTVKARDMLGSKKFNLADNCVIVVNGKTDAQLSNLKPNDRLAFSYDDINGVNVVNRIEPAPAESQTNSMSTTYPVYPGYPTGY